MLMRRVVAAPVLWSAGGAALAVGAAKGAAGLGLIYSSGFVGSCAGSAALVCLGGIGTVRGGCDAVEHALVDSGLAADSVLSAWRAVAPRGTLLTQADVQAAHMPQVRKHEIAQPRRGCLYQVAPPHGRLVAVGARAQLLHKAALRRHQLLHQLETARASQQLLALVMLAGDSSQLAVVLLARARPPESVRRRGLDVAEVDLQRDGRRIGGVVPTHPTWWLTVCHGRMTTRPAPSAAIAIADQNFSEIDFRLPCTMIMTRRAPFRNLDQKSRL